MKPNYIKLTVLLFLINSLLIMAVNMTGRSQYLDSADPHWLKGAGSMLLGELILSPFGLFESDCITILTSVVLLVCSVLAVTYNRNQLSLLSGAFCSLLLTGEVIKLMLMAVFINSGAMLQLS